MNIQNKQKTLNTVTILTVVFSLITIALITTFTMIGFNPLFFVLVGIFGFASVLTYSLYNLWNQNLTDCNLQVAQ